MAEIDNIDWTPVDSSNLKAIRYHGLTQTLDAEFRDGSQYRYTGVEAPVWDSLLRSPSKGEYFSANIAKRGSQKYQGERIK